MASSLVLQGGAAVTKTLKEAITQTAHGFTVGDVIRWDCTLATPKYVLAKADAAANSEVVGVVNAKPDADNFEVTYHGYIDLPQFSGVSAPVLFLSSTVSGGLTYTPPSAMGTVIKPVLTRNTNGSGHLVMNYLGTQIGGSSTIAVDEIQPVGTIMPFAGTVIPDTWLECNGASYSVSAYPELYTKLQYGDGDRAPLYGYVMEMQISNSTVHSATAVGDAIIIRKAGGNISSANGIVGQYDLIGRVRSKTASLTTGSLALVVELVPKYDNGTKSFGFSNTVPNSTSSCNIYSYNQSTPQPAEVDVLTGTWRGSATANITSVAIAAFKTPDMRGRFPVGVNPSAYNQEDADATLASAINGYTMGQLGGEESHTLTTAEMPSHDHNLKALINAVATGSANIIGPDNHNGNFSGTVSTTLTGSDSRPPHTAQTGSNTAHNNMPPYLAVRYIIKAKPYTRAAIIDGIDLPYNSLLVRDLRTRNVGGSNGDLVFYTNKSGDSGNGTERARLTDLTGNTQAETGSGLLIKDDYRACIRLQDTTNDFFANIGAADNGSTSNLVLSTSTNGNGSNYDGSAIILYPGTGTTEMARFSKLGLSIGNVGTQGATLDVSGTLKVSDFSGNTNVMAKANMTANSVGLIVPLLGSSVGSNYYSTAPLPAGTWMVHLTGQENISGANSSGLVDEDTQWVMAKVWTVPTGQYLTFISNQVAVSNASGGNSGVSYRLNTDTNSTFTTIATVQTSPWTQLKSVTDVSIVGTQTPWTGTQTGVVWDGSTSITWLHGYAIRIA